MANDLNKKNEDNEILLVKHKDKDDVHAVKGITEDKKLAVENLDGNQEQFMKVDDNSNALGNFFKNFYRQVKNPKNFIFIKTQLSELDQIKKEIAELKAKGTNFEEHFKDYTVNPDQFLKNQIDPSIVDWDKFQQLGIPKEKVDEFRDLILGYGKTDVMPIRFEIKEAHIHFDGEARLRLTKDGKINAIGVKQKLDLDKPYYSHNFTDDEKKNLKELGHAGGPIMLKDFKTQEWHEHLVGIDQQTNRLVSFKTQYVTIPNKIGNVELTPDQKEAYGRGKEIRVEGLKPKDPSKENYAVNIRFDPDSRKPLYRFDKSEIRIGDTLLGVKLDETQQKQLMDRKAVYIKDMVKDGEKFSAWVKPNDKTKKFDFLSENPDIPKKEAKQSEKNKKQQKQKI